MISNQSTSNKTHVLDLSKLNFLLHKRQHNPSGTKIIRLGMCRCIISLSKITHQMWHNPPFSQGNKATKRVARVEVAGERGGEGGEQHFKKGGRYAI